MAKNKEQKEILEIPEKIGFGFKDCYMITETLENKITYVKYGKGADDIIFVLQDIQRKDPESTVEREDKKIVVTLKKSFDVRTYKSKRIPVDLTERESKRLKVIIEAICLSDLPEGYGEEDLEAMKTKFPKVVKYQTDEENEEFYIKDENEIWIDEGLFNNNGNLLITLSKAFLKSKGLDRLSEAYIDKFEDIVFNYV